MTIKVNIAFTDGMRRQVIYGLEVNLESLTVGDLTSTLVTTQEHLSRILGMTVEIETAAE